MVVFLACGYVSAADFAETVTVLANRTEKALPMTSLPEVIEMKTERLVMPEWLPVRGGQFVMGEEAAFSDAKPPHRVSVPSFEMSKTLVTVEQYAECVKAGSCSIPGPERNNCNWGKNGYSKHPVNCVSWEQAAQYAVFVGGRLPSEAEWEYAARSGGRKQKYPWGDSPATKRLCVMEADTTMPVCSRPQGNTFQGLCDMAGNLMQWVQDNYQETYSWAPSDGSAYAVSTGFRVVRGGSFLNEDPEELRADYRSFAGPREKMAYVGFRVARSIRVSR